MHVCAILLYRQRGDAAMLMKVNIRNIPSLIFRKNHFVARCCGFVNTRADISCSKSAATDDTRSGFRASKMHLNASTSGSVDSKIYIYIYIRICIYTRICRLHSSVSAI